MLFAVVMPILQSTCCVMPGVLIVAMAALPRNPSMSLPSKRVEGDDDITSLGTFASKHASCCRIWNPISIWCGIKHIKHIKLQILCFPMDSTEKGTTHPAALSPDSTWTTLRQPPTLTSSGFTKSARLWEPQSSRPRTKHLDERGPQLHQPHDTIWHSATVITTISIYL